MPISGKTNRRLRDRRIDYFSRHSAIGGQSLFTLLIKREKARHFGTNGLEIRNDAKSSINHEGSPAPADGFFDLPRNLVNSDNPESNNGYVKRRGIFQAGHPICSTKAKTDFDLSLPTVAMRISSTVFRISGRPYAAAALNSSSPDPSKT